MPARLNSDVLVVGGTATADWPGANRMFKYPPKPPPPPLLKLLKLLLGLTLVFVFVFMLLRKALKSNGTKLLGPVFAGKPPPNDN